MRDGMLAPTDGDLMYLQARVKRGASVTLDEGTLTVKRQRPGTRFLFVEYPSLVADSRSSGFSATPSSSKEWGTNQTPVVADPPPRAPPSRGFVSEWRVVGDSGGSSSL